MLNLSLKCYACDLIINPWLVSLSPSLVNPGLSSITYTEMNPSTWDAMQYATSHTLSVGSK